MYFSCNLCSFFQEHLLLHHPAPFACRNGSEVYQQIAVSALGYSSSDCYDILIDELQPLMDEYHSERSRVWLTCDKTLMSCSSNDIANTAAWHMICVQCNQATGVDQSPTQATEVDHFDKSMEERFPGDQQ